MIRIKRIVIRYLRKAKQTFCAIFFMFFDSLLFVSVHNKVESSRTRVLIVRLDAIGDFVLWLHTAENYRKLYPKDLYTITLLGNDLWAPLARSVNFFDDIWELNRRRFTSNVVYRSRMLRKIRKANFEIVVQPTYSRELCYGDAVVRVSRAKTRIGSTGNFSNIRPWQKQVGDRWYTQLIASTPEQLMELSRNAEFLRGLGIADVKASLPLLSLVNKDILQPNGPYVILFPGASESIKQWPLKYYVNLARMIYHQLRWTIVVCGGPQETDLGKAFEKSCDVPILNYIGKTTLVVLISLIARAKLLVGNDTSAIHIASAVSTPSVCIAGGGHYGRFVPYTDELKSLDELPTVVTSKKNCFNCNWRCIYPLANNNPPPCIGEVSASDVWNNVLNIVGKFHKR